MIRRLRRLFETSGLAAAIGVVLLCALVLLRTWDPLPLQVLRLRTFDLYQALQPRDRGESQVVVVDIDDKSLNQVGQWPWPRTTVRDLVLALARSGVAAIAFDVIFAEPDRLSPGALADQLEDGQSELAQQLRRLPSNDAQLADAMKRIKVVLAQAAAPRQLEPERAPVKPASIALLNEDPRSHLLRADGLVRNVPVLEQAAAGLGMVSLWPSPDNIVRRMPLMINASGELYPSLPLELLRVALGESTYVVETSAAGIEQIIMGRYAIPTDRSGRFWVYYGAHQPGRYVSASSVLDGSAETTRLVGKLILIGTSATGLRDIRATPLEANMPGVEVHAQALETVLQNKQLARPAFADAVEIFVTALAGLIVIVLVPIAGPLGTLLAGAVVAAGILGGSLYAFLEHLRLFDPSYGLVASFFVFTIMVFFNYVREGARRRSVRNAFGHYLAPALVDRITQNPDMLVLGGEQRETTVLFSDIRGFTSIAERYADDPQGLTRLINRFLTPMSDQVILHQGTIDKYMGDAMMAFWNAPVSDPDHPTNACRAALAMQGALDDVNAELAEYARAARQPPVALQIGVGLNTGVCVAGNLGSESHFNYSVLGDAVNLASRLEGLTRYYDIAIVVGNATAEAVSDHFALLEIDLIRVKGKEVPERIFVLLGDEVMAGKPQFAKLANANNELLARYRAQDWRGARENLGMCRRLAAYFHIQGVYDLYETRLDEYEVTPPPADWDGVYTAQDKAYNLVKQVRRFTLEPGDCVFEEGDPGGSAFLIVSGRVEVHAQGTELAILGAGDLLGEMSFLERTNRSAAARALDPTVLVEIEADTLLQSLGGTDSDAAAFVSGLIAKLRATNRRLIQADRKAPAPFDPEFSRFDQDA